MYIKDPFESAISISRILKTIDFKNIVFKIVTF